MRLRKGLDELQEKDVLLIAQISDALAHPARIKIFRFIMAGTVEEKILAMHREKRDLAAGFLEGTEQAVKRITDEELLELLR